MPERAPFGRFDLIRLQVMNVAADEPVDGEANGFFIGTEGGGLDGRRCLIYFGGAVF